ncbi:MAG: hypothetical protein GC190_21430 [Alphaproteobacteria bacterium]|nr:hypothetical protein [Alphaproteobacteria bacterium]
MFEGWDTFYLVAGGGAGVFIGAMFVVATLTGDIEADRLRAGAQVYITPVVFHFGVVLVTSLLAAVPKISPGILGLILALGTALGLGYGTTTAIRLFRLDWSRDAPDLSDKFFYAIAPVIAYAALGIAALYVWFGPEDAPYVIAIVLILLLALGVRNAWDVATAIVQGASRNDKSES